MSEPTPGLSALLAQATPEAERDWESFWMCQAEAKVVALAPDAVSLLVDIVNDGRTQIHTSLLARYLELDRRAAQ